MSLIFYTNPQSRGRIVRWMLEEIGQPYRTEVLPYGPAMKSPEYLAINPMGKVPTLRHGDTVVTEVCGDLCLSGRRLPGGTAGTADQQPPAGSLLPLVILCRRTARGGHFQ